MVTAIKKITLGLSVSAIIISCGQHRKDAAAEDSPEVTALPSKIDIDQEIETWKNELISNKTLGEPCNYEDVDIEKRKEWTGQNENQLDGFPKDRDSIKTANADFDDDGGEDVLLYFNSTNCTGHNGGTPSFAKIIYSNGKTDPYVADEIQKAILADYNEKRKTVYSLKEITDNYLQNSISINYKDRMITGSFHLYTNNDAHCCPSYSGTYTYDPKLKQAKIELTENEV